MLVEGERGELRQAAEALAEAVRVLLRRASLLEVELGGLELREATERAPESPHVGDAVAAVAADVQLERGQERAAL